ncbi:hypothetical protein [Curtobacterium sp. MCBD17_040]|uniref:hypothetical protein n=1 Tax=Curtobacterium sp. MCBD17_040 TaxID=2175674 RepID=UPI000DA76C39|nr:hypothetical protein [Curtobacterium sp. MCBD17_040]WIB65729.1 hypothetical protein DEI94_16545 [Curtobacterium sp. MCBD17_040]
MSVAESESESEFAAMTVNERLSVAGLLPVWDAAVRRRDREAVASLLGRVGLADQVNEIADAAFAAARSES